MKITAVLLFAALLVYIFIRPLGLTTSCKISKKTISEGDVSVEVSVFSMNTDPKQSVIMMPPTGGMTVLEERYARTLCDSQTDVVLVSDWGEPKSDFGTELTIHQKLLGRAQQAIEAVLNQLTTSQVGIMGTSVGALHAATAVGRLERIDKAYLILAGAPVAEVIARSDQKALKKARQKRFEIYNFKDIEEYIDALSKVIEWDPQRFVNGALDKKITLIMSRSDQTVPASTQVHLATQWPQAEKIYVTGNHMLSIVKAWWFHASTARDFFAHEKTMGNPN